MLRRKGKAAAGGGAEEAVGDAGEEVGGEAVLGDVGDEDGLGAGDVFCPAQRAEEVGGGFRGVGVGGDVPVGEAFALERCEFLAEVDDDGGLERPGVIIAVEGDEEGRKAGRVVRQELARCDLWRLFSGSAEERVLDDDAAFRDALLERRPRDGAAPVHDDSDVVVIAALDFAHGGLDAVRARRAVFAVQDENVLVAEVVEDVLRGRGADVAEDVGGRRGHGNSRRFEQAPRQRKRRTAHADRRGAGRQARGQRRLGGAHDRQRARPESLR
mmetsp:Transcript_3323/g.10210  ORF Transcript_3323/g.10210 Transcript_3323/m.10210 type:complete len:271 (+) Transcript_3323:158-970(+)